MQPAAKCLTVSDSVVKPFSNKAVSSMQVRIAQVLVGSRDASASYEDTDQPVQVNKTAWQVTVVDDYGCEEVFYFQSE